MAHPKLVDLVAFPVWLPLCLPAVYPREVVVWVETFGEPKTQGFIRAPSKPVVCRRCCIGVSVATINLDSRYPFWCGFRGSVFPGLDSRVLVFSSCSCFPRIHNPSYQPGVFPPGKDSHKGPPPHLSVSTSSGFDFIRGSNRKSNCSTGLIFPTVGKPPGCSFRSPPGNP